MLSTKPLKRIEFNHSYQDLNELHNLGCKIIENTNQNDPDSIIGYSVSVVEGDQNTDLSHINLYSDVANLKHEIHSARFLDKMRIAIPQVVPILNYNDTDAITVSRHTLVLSKSAD